MNVQVINRSAGGRPVIDADVVPVRFMDPINVLSGRVQQHERFDDLVRRQVEERHDMAFRYNEGMTFGQWVAVPANLEPIRREPGE